MSKLATLWETTSALSTMELLTYLITERFSGRTVVTASLRARSVVVLKLISRIAPETPVVFCHAAQLYPESISYRERLIAMLGLEDVRDVDSHVANLDQSQPAPNDHDHVERIRADDLVGGGTVSELVHLNADLADFDCWISAVYHDKAPAGVKHRVDLDGRLVKVNPLLDWSDADVRRFMLANELPYHPRVSVAKPEQPDADRETSPLYSY